jgi:hypothetical protein
MQMNPSSGAEIVSNSYEAKENMCSTRRRRVSPPPEEKKVGFRLDRVSRADCSLRDEKKAVALSVDRTISVEPRPPYTTV